ncbi:tetratricopeptide repeat protein [Calothrix sp. FACHB-1219]|uniref:CHAT domain-containing protein n=1 Tax=unclassified Calothrix TaxID=2619626 RepID=UPI0016844C38|nr:MULTISPECIES: CHAT domain-containing tetratricopeptide repeat protein [unclassified Calothrix]MBD2205887.1 tetratricopeptide repeat protein [Calothrix sp. FACHB-168]MBD2220716.1 tetratricopeptide repeat protein [Calothrix sp. FACHB-1219]
MNCYRKYIVVATVVFSLVSSPVFLPLSGSVFLAQAQTTQKEIAEQILQLYQKATQLYKQGQFTEALKTLQQVLALMKELGLEKEQGTILNNIGLMYSNLGQYNQAIAAYEQALTITKKNGDTAAQAPIFNNIGDIYRQQGQYTKALEFYQQALAIHKQFNNQVGQGISLNNIGVVYRNLGKYAQALEFYQQALAIYQKINNQAEIGTTLNNIGLVYDSMGQYTKALEFYQQALTIHKKLGNQVGESSVLNNLGLVYDNLGKYAQALEFYQQALAINQKIGDKAGEALNYNNIGGVYRLLGQYAKALKFYQQSLAIAKNIGDKPGEARTIDNMGAIYRLSQQYPQALAAYEQALAIRREIGDKPGEGITLHNTALLYEDLGQYPQALDLYQKSLAIAKELGDKGGEGTTIDNIGSIYYKLAKYPQALQFAQQGLAIRQQVGDKPGQAISLNNIGLLYLELGEYANAEKNLFAAIDILESLRPGLTDADKVSFFEQQAFTYRFLQQALIAQNKINSALEVSDRARARAFIELLAAKQSETANPQLDIKHLTIQQIQNIAKVENATIVQYSIIDDKLLYIWLIKPTGEITFKPVDLSKATDTPLSQLVTMSRKAMGVLERGIFQPQSSLQPNPTQQLQKLYQILIKPIAQDLPTDANARVIFVPQESLFVVPFAALQDEQGKYLIDKHTILTAPAIQVLELTRKQKQNLNKSLKDVLVVGNPMMPTIPITDEKLIPLPGAEKEAKQIAALLKTQAIIGNKATETAIVSKMKQARIIHFATHGLLDDFKGLGVPGAIALTASNQDDGFLTSSEILDMKLNAELVVLSACNTAGGNITGDGVIGLSRSLITAGVPSVIVSLWAVNDDSTAFLMSEFYRQLQKNPDKAVALRQAILTTKKQYSHPFDWAAFTLIGEAD